MAGPFYNNIKGTTAIAPLMVAFTPNAASAGFLAWSTVPAGWVGLVRYEEGSAWELQYSYWNGTTLSRSATAQFVSSSSGSGLTLTAAATASMVMDASEIAPHLGVPWRSLAPNVGNATFNTFGFAAATLTGTAAASAIDATNYLTEQPRVQLASATTINAQAGPSHTTAMAVTSTTAGRGGWEFACRLGATTLPVGPRLYVGMTAVTFVGFTAEPSTRTANYAVLGLDSTDTSMQFLTNSGVGAGTKISTGIALAVNGWYEVTIWSDPGSATVKMLLVRLDTGAIYYGTTATDVPVTGSLMFPQCLGGLNGINTGTAFTMQSGGYIIRTGAG